MKKTFGKAERKMVFSIVVLILIALGGYVFFVERETRSAEENRVKIEEPRIAEENKNEEEQRAEWQSAAQELQIDEEQKIAEETRLQETPLYTPDTGNIFLQELISEEIKKAEAGDAEAQILLCAFFFKGERGFRQDYKEAFKWASLAAEQGDVKGQQLLGEMYHVGIGVPKDDNQSFKWHALAAEQGDAVSQRILGKMYSSGMGVPQDDNQAFKWASLAAEQGDAKAQCLLGVKYDEGKGVLKDENKASYWFIKAAERGDVNAQWLLAGRYFSGKGVPQDLNQSCYWVTQLAEQGDAGAQNLLGSHYYSGGLGVPKNHIYSYAWASLSAAQGDKTAIANRDKVEAGLTPEERTIGQQLAVELQSKIGNRKRPSRSE